MLSEIAVLLQFLGSTLPQALIVKSGVLTGVVGALVSLALRAPAARRRKKWLAPVLALLLGQIAGWASVGFNGGQGLLGVGLGAFIGLSAIGAHSGGKNGQEALTARRSRKRAA